MDTLKNEANYFRVCRLLIGKGSDALRVVLHSVHAPSTLPGVLNAKKAVLEKIRGSVITNKQWDLLFPASGAAPDSNNFDITLLTILLRNICGLSPPTKGWNEMPLADDISKSADIVRIKSFRNEVYGHTASAQLDDTKFESLWQQISQPLIRRGVPQKDIDEIKVAPLSPEEVSYIEQLKDAEKEISELRQSTSCLRNKLPEPVMFIGREDEITKVFTLLNDEKMAVVTLHGGPGFGKTAIASHVSQQLSVDPKLVVVFSHLRTAKNVDEMIRQLCLDAGVDHKNDPKQSLILRLRNIKKKVVFVMDNIDNLLEEDRSNFEDFIRQLIEHSNCQIITTSRSCYLISDLSTDSVDVREMKVEASVELLRKKCRKQEECCHQDEEFLEKLAVHCGHVPLAMCIAGSLLDDYLIADKLLEDLENQPMKTLECRKSNQFVKRAINLSYEKCSKEEQETFVCLSVFEGSFSEEATIAVSEKKESDTRRVLKELCRRSLIEQLTQHRYSIHLLIKHFLKDEQESGNEERVLAAAKRAKLLMIEYYLEFGHKRTTESYSKDGYKDAREALKREASNIHNVLKICCQQEHPTSSDISHCLAHSNIYTTSARLFSIFVRTITSAATVNNFLQRCANLAKDKEQYATKINFDCLLVAEERYESIGNDDFTSLTSQMEEIKNEFDTRYEQLKNDKSLCAHYYYQYGRYLCLKSESHAYERKKKLDLLIQAREQLEKCFELRKTLTKTPVATADIIFSLLQLGKICKAISSTENRLRKRDESQTSLAQTKEYYKEAIRLSQDTLGDHELTSSCYKHSGDLFLKTKEFDLAEKEYTTAKDMWEKLELDTSEKYVFILKNLGGCLIECKRGDEAIKVLEEALSIAEKLPKSAKLENVWWIRAYTSLAIAYDLVQKNDKAVCHAKKAMELTFKKELKKIIPYHHQQKLLEILRDNKS